MEASDQLKTAIKSVRINLMSCFVLKNQGQLISQTLKALLDDVEANSGWYEMGAQEKFVFSLQDFLRRVLRYVKVNLKVTDLVPVGLGDLRRARSLCNITNLRMELTSFTSELQILMFTSSISQRLPNLHELFSGEKVAVAFDKDSAAIQAAFNKIFLDLTKAFPEDQFLTNFFNQFVGNLSSKASLTYEDLNSHELSDLSYKLEHKLFTMTTNEPTDFNALQMDTRNLFRNGKFGKIFNGKIGGISMICVQEISKKQLETLSSSGRIKLFSTLRATGVLKSEFLVNIEGISFHQGNLYIINEKIYYSLDELLHGHSGFPARVFTIEELIASFSAVSKALERIHKDGMVHGDVRPANIFFTRKSVGANFTGCVKLAFFNYELNLDELHWSNWSDESLVYQAPEVLGNKSFTSASDMYSLAICLWEAMHDDSRPFADFNTSSGDLVSAIKSGLRPDFSTDAAQWLINMVQESWAADAFARLTASKWIGLFDNIMTQKGHMDPDQIYEFVNATVKRRNNNGAPEPKGKSNPSYSKPGGSVVSHSTLQNAVNRPLPPVNGGPPPPPHGSFVAVEDYDTGYASPLPKEPPRQPPREPPREPMPRPLPPMMDRNEDGYFDTSRPLPSLGMADPPRPNYGFNSPNMAGPPPPIPARVSDVNSGFSRPLPPIQDSPYANAGFPGQHRGYDGGSVESFASPNQKGVNGMSAEQIEGELKRFYEDEDPAMIDQIDKLVEWCLENGLEEFNKLLLKDFDKGLYMFRKDEPPAQQMGKKEKPRGGLASIFGIKKPGGRPPGL